MRVNFPLVGTTHKSIFLFNLNGYTMMTAAQKTVVLRTCITTHESLEMEPLFGALQKYKEELNLSDYHYYQLIRKTVEEMYKEVEMERRLIFLTSVEWYFMLKSGYRVRLANSQLKYLFLYVHSTERLNTITYGMFDGDRYYNVSSVAKNRSQQRIIIRENTYVPVKEGKEFVFGLKKMPRLGNDPVPFNLSFEWQDQAYELTGLVSGDVNPALEDYPQVAPMDYISLEVSEELKTSLLPQLQEILRDKTVEEKVSFVTSLCRKSLEYTWDWVAYERDDPLTADQTLIAEFSDHEDRVALQYWLLKELVNLPMLVLAHFNDDLSLAVALPNPVGKPFHYKDTTFTICDPVVPNNSDQLGIYPNGMRNGNSEVYVEGEYWPQGELSVDSATGK